MPRRFALVHVYGAAVGFQCIMIAPGTVAEIMQRDFYTRTCQGYNFIKEVDGTAVIGWGRGIETNNM